MYKEVLQQLFAIGADGLLPENLSDNLLSEIMKDSELAHEIARLRGLSKKEVREALTAEALHRNREYMLHNSEALAKLVKEQQNRQKN